jgi:PEGA domain
MTHLSPSRGALVAGCVLSLALSSAQASAQQPPAENVAAARALGLQGVQLADGGDCTSAIEKLSRAEALYHAPTILGRLGECQVVVGQIVLGTENLNRVVREELPTTAPKAFRDAQERAKAALAAALPRIAKLTVKVEPADAAAQVTVAGMPLPTALFGVERPTDPGVHEVVVSAPGYVQQKANVTLTEGEAEELDIRLVKDPATAVAPPASPPPTLTVTSAPTSPAVDRRGGGKALAFVSLGVGGAGLVVGGVTGILAANKKGDLACEAKRCPTSQKDTLDSARSLATVSTVGFAVGLVGVGVGVVLLLTGNDANDATHAAQYQPRAAGRSNFSVEPWLTSDAAGVSGTF